MTAVNSTIREIVGIVNRRRGNGCGQNKAVIGIDRGMFFKSVMGNIFLYNPIRVQIPGEFFGFTVFIKFTFRRIVFFFQFLEFLVADRPAGGFNESGINSDAFIDGKALAFELTEDF